MNFQNLNPWTPEVPHTIIWTAYTDNIAERQWQALFVNIVQLLDSVGVSILVPRNTNWTNSTTIVSNNSPLRKQIGAERKLER